MVQSQQMQYDLVYSFLIKKLETELPPFLHYHNSEHTKEVIEGAEKLAKKENISGDDLTILKTAALFHDTGFLETYSDHEEISCEMARKWLPDYGYGKKEIDEICRLIMATKLPQQPKDKLAEILCDADLYYMGTDRYFIGAEKLYKELHQAGFVKDRDEWRKEEIRFVEGQHYFTKTAQKKNLAAN